jgi:hypothetical protein
MRTVVDAQINGQTHSRCVVVVGAIRCPCKRQRCPRRCWGPGCVATAGTPGEARLEPVVVHGRVNCETNDDDERESSFPPRTSTVCESANSVSNVSITCTHDHGPCTEQRALTSARAGACMQGRRANQRAGYAEYYKWVESTIGT